MAKSNLIMREKTCVVYVKNGATAEELEKVKRLRELGWISKPCITKEEKEKNKINHDVTKDFNISYDEVHKEDMIKYLEDYGTEEQKKAFAYHAFRDINGNPVYNKDGKPKFNMISAKRYFYKTFFSDRWIAIEKMLEDRKFKASKKKETEDKLLKWLND